MCHRLFVSYSIGNNQGVIKNGRLGVFPNVPLKLRRFVPIHAALTPNPTPQIFPAVLHIISPFWRTIVL